MCAWHFRLMIKNEGFVSDCLQSAFLISALVSQDYRQSIARAFTAEGALQSICAVGRSNRFISSGASQKHFCEENDHRQSCASLHCTAKYVPLGSTASLDFPLCRLSLVLVKETNQNQNWSVTYIDEDDESTAQFQTCHVASHRIATNIERCRC